MKKKNDMNIKRGIIPYYLFKRNSSRMSLFQLSVSYILRENSLSEKKTLNDFGNVTCICIFSKGKSAKCMEIKQKK